MKIKEETIEEIKRRADIVEIIGEYVVLKKTGANFKGVCPFHQEKTPSFIVNPDKQIFHCFGCNAGGNAITFLMNYNKQSFYDVIIELANRVGVRLEYLEGEGEKDEEKELREKLKRINLYAKQYGEIARNYLKKRDIISQSQEKFMVGYAQNSWDSLFRYLTHEGFTTDILEKSGLFVPKEDNQGFYDRFRNRIMFPIFDERGEIIAFGGRTLVNNQAKYINSPETSLYVKGNHLYALNFAKDSIRANDHVLLMEGYIDVITAHRYGFSNAVATLGTALTPVQAKHLLRFSNSKKVIVAYDTDEAGIKAADRGIDVLEGVAKGCGISIFIAEIPMGKDPDSYLHMTGKEGFDRVLKAAKPIIEWELEQVLKKGDTKSPIGKSEIIKNSLPILLRIDDRIYRDECVKMLAYQIEIREDILRQELKDAYRGKKVKEPQKMKKLSEPTKNIYKAEQGLIFIMLEFNEYRSHILVELVDVDFEDKIHNELKLMIADFHDKQKEFIWQDLLSTSLDPQVHAKITEIINNNTEIIKSSSNSGNYERLIKDYLSCLHKAREENEVAKIIKDIETAQKNQQYTLAEELLYTYNKKLTVKN